MSGGLSRHTTLLEKQRQKSGNLIYVDNGGLFASPSETEQKLIADVGLDVHTFNKLDAMNLSQREFYLGTEFLAQKVKDLSFPLISTNISSKVELPWLKKYAIKKIGKQKVAILGIIPENAFASNINPTFAQNISVEAPEKAVKETLAKIKKEKVGIVILLSQLNVEETSKLLEKIPEINLAVAHSTEQLCKMTDNPKQIIVPDSVNGQYFLSADITVDSTGKVKVSQNPPVALDDSVQHTEAIDTMISASFKEAREKRKAARKQVDEHLKQQGAVALQPMSKEEFFAAVNKKKAELKELRGEEGEEVKGRFLLNGEEIPATIRKIRPSDSDSQKAKPAEKSEMPQ